MDKNGLITKIFYEEGSSLIVLANDLYQDIEGAKTGEESDLLNVFRTAERIAEWVKYARQVIADQTILETVTFRSRSGIESERKTYQQLLKDLDDL